MIPDLSILVTSDLHGRAPPLTATQAAESFYFDNGDTLFSAAPGSQGRETAEAAARVAIAALAARNCRAAVPGNHEFDQGLATFLGLARSSPFPWIAANLVDAGGRHLLDPEMILMTRQGRRIRFVGLLDPAACVDIPAADLAGARLLDPAAALAELLAGGAAADLLVVSIHGGFQQGRQASAEDADHELPRRFPEIDLLITGHDHRSIIRRQGECLCLQPGAYGAQSATVEVDFVSARPRLQARIEHRGAARD
ncbi:MAG: hypothetical protein RL095_2740 [Verrucomicrobiota bacterium]|jgi:2',3'-cyclic-nucleotide 2'-phosphodiesterase/3'-nucleotidase